MEYKIYYPKTRPELVTLELSWHEFVALVQLATDTPSSASDKAFVQSRLGEIYREATC